MVPAIGTAAQHLVWVRGRTLWWTANYKSCYGWNIYSHITEGEAAAWSSFVTVVKGFLGTKKKLVTVQIDAKNFQDLGVIMSIKTHYRFNHLNRFLENLADVRHQDHRAIPPGHQDHGGIPPRHNHHGAISPRHHDHGGIPPRHQDHGASPPALEDQPPHKIRYE